MIGMPGLFIAIAEWLACMLHMTAFKRKYKTVLYAVLCLVGLAVLLAQNILFGYLPYHIALKFLSAVISLILMVALVFCCVKISFKNAVFYGCSSFILAGFVASVHWQLYYYFYTGFDFAKETWFKALWCTFIYSACLALICLINSRLFKNSKISCASNKDIIFILILTCFCLLAANIKFYSSEGVWTERRIREGNEIRTLVYICGLALAYFNRIMSDRITYMSELTAINQVMDNQYRQYKIYKENDDAINRHYHDLKHQLDVILSEEDTEKRSQYLVDMQNSIKLRQSEKVTGNKVVDVILSGKSIECVQNEINLSVVADGCLLDFMSQLDICSVLGNCLDNAIEYVKKIEDKEKRIIQVALFKQNAMVVLRVKNYFDGKLNYQGGDIVTTKTDKADHGYGLKSVRMVTDKYGGNMKIITEDGWFTICLLFPQSCEQPI